MPTILIACCPHDTPTVYGYYYLRQLLTPILTGNGFKVVFLKNANLQNFRYALEKYNPDFVILNGHGGYKAVKGCNENFILGVKTYDPIFETKIFLDNAHWMRNRIVYLFTCNAGKELALKLVQQGALSVAAYTSSFFFLSEDSHPPADRKAYPFFNAALQLPVKLAEGYNFAQAVSATKTAFQHYVEQAEAQGDELTAKYLWHDLSSLVAYGNMNARLINPIPLLFPEVKT
jgi:hypothetical protein